MYIFHQYVDIEIDLTQPNPKVQLPQIVPTFVHSQDLWNLLVFLFTSFPQIVLSLVHSQEFWNLLVL